MKTKYYKIRIIGSTKWLLVKGRTVKLKGFENIDMFYHKKNDMYIISELSTGRKLTTASKLKFAKRYILENFNQSELLTRINYLNQSEKTDFNLSKIKIEKISA